MVIHQCEEYGPDEAMSQPSVGLFHHLGLSFLASYSSVQTQALGFAFINIHIGTNDYIVLIEIFFGQI